MADQVQHERVQHLHRIGEPFHVLAKRDDCSVRRMRHGAQFGGAYLGIAVDGTEPSVKEAAIVECRQAPGFVLRESSAAPVNIVEMVLDPDLGNRELRREPKGPPSACAVPPWR